MSTIVEPHCLSMKSWAHFFCRSVPSTCSTWAKDGPDEYIQMGAFAPSTISAIDHHSARGAGVPPRLPGRSSRQNSASMNAWYDFLNDSGRSAVCVTGSKRGGLRSLSV